MCASSPRRSRELEHVRLGLSARGCLALIRVAKTWAAADGRTHVVPQDVVTLASPVLCHRLILDAEAAFRGVTVDDVIQQLLASVPAPRTGPEHLARRGGRRPSPAPGRGTDPGPRRAAARARPVPDARCGRRHGHHRRAVRPADHGAGVGRHHWLGWLEFGVIAATGGCLLAAALVLVLLPHRPAAGSGSTPTG